GPAAPGQYWTAVNIHNPHKCNKAHFRPKLAIANPLHVGPVSAFFGPYDLGPDEAFEIDRPHIATLWPLIFPGQTAPAFVKGYLVIESDIELDVVAVYTTAQTATGPVTNFYTERVPARCVPVCEDLVLPLHTGFADWRTVVPLTNAPVVAIPTANWGAPPLGSKWVSQFGPDTVQTTRRYQLSFELCSGFTNPSPPCELMVQVNDTATVFLNNLQVAPTPVLLLPNPTSVMLPGNSAFRAGLNHLEVVVTNAGGETGFALTGILYVPRGKCPCAKLPIAPLK
ncbi:MAG: hypothetical protein JWO45_1687, partial [Spartobacteria bacterium]|nr:hypothetical protein [Spartobacteria bacterium]